MQAFFSRAGLALLCLLLTALLIAALFWALSIGTVDLPPDVIATAIIDQIQSGTPIDTAGKGPVHDIVWLLRLPRLLLAAIIGAGLATCGVVMQAIVKNPLADPYILGIGAALGENAVGIAAFLGAFAVSVGVLFIANIGGRANAMKLLLGGMALSAVCSAFSSFIVYFANDKEGIQTITYWMMGSLAGAKWEHMALIGGIVALAVLFFWSQSRILNLMLLGDASAITLGTDLHPYRQIYLIVSALVVGFAVFAAGMIGFVGLVVPHIVRMLVGTDHKRLIPVTALTGAIFLVVADGLCRVLIPHTELPIGILIALVGAPAFIYLMVKRTYGFGGQ